MKKAFVYLMLAAAWTQFAYAADAGKANVSLTTEPFRYIHVDGDNEKFEAHHWIPADSYDGGIRDFSLNAQMPDDVLLESNARALFGSNDYDLDLKLEKEDAWYVALDYQEFRKYYENTGGVYYPFIFYDHPESNRELHLDIGHIEVEAGWTPADRPDIIFWYRHDFRDGAKSRLTWTPVTEGGLTKNIGPSWQDVNESTDAFKITLKDSVNGIDWHASQKWEVFDAEYLRTEKALSTDAAASGRKIRAQDQEPETTSLETQLGAERWFRKDKVFASSNYRFSQMDNKEIESILETDENGVPTNFSNPKQIVDALATNQFRSHTAVGHLLWLINDALNLTNRVKFSDILRDSSSTYPADSSPNAVGGAAPNGTIDQVDVTENDGQLRQWAHSASLRFGGIPHTALYTDWEYSQTRNRLLEDRQSASAGERFNREVIGHLYRGVGTVGARYSPSSFFDATASYRRREDDIHYNNVRFVEPTSSSARSVFIDGQDILTDEFSAGFKLRPVDWFEPSFRYQRIDRDYNTWGIPDDQAVQESRQLSDVYTWDGVFHPGQDWLVTASFSLQDAFVETPASNATTSAQAPTFNTDTYSWLIGAEYSVSKDLTLNGLVSFARATNFNDFTAVGGLPLGSEYEETGVGVGVQWSLNKDWSVEPRYDYYHYKPNEHAEYGQYDAHVVWVAVKVNWS